MLGLYVHELLITRCLQMNNPLAHELTTAPEIIEAVTATPPTPVHPSSGKVDMFVAGAGTGGTVSGVAKGIKKAHNSHCIIVGVDPVR
jgi:cystathionine beta-synthase